MIDIEQLITFGILSIFALSFAILMVLLKMKIYTKRLEIKHGYFRIINYISRFYHSSTFLFYRMGFLTR